MIIVKLKGGFGNQLFQYATGRQLSLYYNVPLLLDLSYLEVKQFERSHTTRFFELDKLQIVANIATPKDITSVKRQGCLKLFGSPYLREKKMRFNPKVLRVGANAFLDGFWQSEKYFMSIKQNLYHEFTFKTAITDTYLLGIKKEIEIKNSVSIHFRRGDYVTNHVASKNHGVCSMEYYEKAVELIANQVQNPIFFVFSDDIQWVKKEFHCRFTTHYIDKSIEDIHSDFQLMTLCKHNIIANSSYSWWAAWLNQNKEKIVVAPKRWFADVKQQAQTNDLIPQSWIKI